MLIDGLISDMMMSLEYIDVIGAILLCLLLIHGPWCKAQERREKIKSKNLQKLKFMNFFLLIIIM